MSKTPGLEKQLYHMDLSGGMDERSRPELMASNVAVTKIQNLVQNQTGAWVKSPGTVTTSMLDDSGAPIVIPKSCFRSIDSGLCTISADGNLYHYQESLDSWEKKNIASEFSVDSAFVASSQAKANQVVISYTSNSRYEVIVYQTYTSGTAMVVYDRESELEVKTYDLSDLGTVTTARVTFVTDRYLHVWIGNGTTTTKLVVIDTLDLNWPQDLSAYTPITGVNSGLRDVTSNDDFSFAVTGVGTSYVLSATPTGTVVSQVLVEDYYSLSLDLTGLLWIAGKDTGKLTVQARDATDITLAAVHGPWTDAAVDVATPLVGAYASGKIGVINNVTSTTLGGSTIGTLYYYETSGPSATAVTKKATLNGWVSTSMPFLFTIVVDKMYTQVMKLDASSTTSPVAVICLSDLTTSQWTTDPFYLTSARLAATLNPESSKLWTPGTPARPRVWNDDENKSHVTLYSSVPVTARTDAFVAYYLSGPDAAQYVTARFGPANYIGTGATGIYDGSSVVEAGFVDYPILDVSETGNAGNPDGEYGYLAVFKYVNKFGDVTYSRSYGPIVVTTAVHTVTMTVHGCHVTNKERGGVEPRVIIEVYRTVSGGTQYFLCGTTQAGGTQVLTLSATDGFFSFDDDLSDAALQSQPLMYRQPGTPNSALDRFAPYATRSVTQHKDRVFYIDPTGQNVKYSSFFVDGEAAWFSPLFSFRVHGGTGRITALASMDSRLFAFKRDGVWVVDGDGPPENGGTGAEFSTPQSIATAFGCIEPRSIVVTPIGIMYQSKRGIELLDHSLHVNWIGDKVQDTAKLFPVCTSAVLSHDNRRVRFSMMASEPAIITGVDACILVFDFTQGAWSKEVPVKNDGTTVGIQSMCVSDILGVERTVLVDDSEIRYMDDDVGYEDFNDGFTTPARFYIPSILETGWVRISSPQARQRIYDILTLMKKAGGNHKITLELAFNYADAYTQTLVFEPDVINQLTIEELMIQPSIQDVLALRFRISDAEPTDTVQYPIGVARGYELLDITYNMAPKPGAPKLASIQKG